MNRQAALADRSRRYPAERYRQAVPSGDDAPAAHAPTELTTGLDREDGSTTFRRDLVMSGKPTQRFTTGRRFEHDAKLFVPGPEHPRGDDQHAIRAKFFLEMKQQ